MNREEQQFLNDLDKRPWNAADRRVLRDFRPEDVARAAPTFPA